MVPARISPGTLLQTSQVLSDPSTPLPRHLVLSFIAVPDAWVRVTVLGTVSDVFFSFVSALLSLFLSFGTCLYLLWESDGETSESDWELLLVIYSG